MAVTVEKRPIGVTLGSAVSATINQNYGSAYATVNKTSHGLSDGQYVYIKCNVENYNGFWIVDVTNANEFILRDAPYVAWIVDCDCTYYPQATTHGWSCVHLPIVYELSNTRFPINQIDTSRTISSISNDGGYVKLNLSGSLGTFEELTFIKISNAPTSSNNGIYQIVDKTSTSVVTINLSYATVTNAGLAGATVQLYYSNYTILVRVYAGINSSHQWDDQKPYELAATLQLTPESDNTVKFSIHEILKSYVKTKNNLTLATLPNNIDQWTNFYIEVAEQYDTSNGYTITTTTSVYASDQGTFEGTAANAMLAFKNVHSGYLSEYLMINSTSKFLTLFAIPVLFGCSEDEPNCYQDISFATESNVTLRQEYYSNSVLQSTVDTVISAYGAGVYRVPLSQNCLYDRVDVSLLSEATPRAFSGSAFGAAPQFGSGSDNDWDQLSGQGVNLIIPAPAASDQSKVKYLPYTVDNAQDLSVTVNWTLTIVSGFVSSTNIQVRLYDAAFNQLDSFDISLGTASTSGSTTDLLTAPANTAYIAFFASAVSGSIGTSRASINSFTVNTQAGLTISETKQFDIDCGCSDQEIRLTWLNNLGGFDYWKFTGQSEHTIDIANSGETKENTFPEWGKSYGEFADTIRKQTYRETAKRQFIYSQFLTQDQADALAYIKSSPLVQIINSRTDRRTVLVDTDSFTKYKDGDKTYTVQFNILFTDDIPSQSA